MKQRPGLRPELLPVAILTYLGLVWVSSYLIDVVNLFELRNSIGWEPPFLWYEMFREASITEVMQWTMLAAATVLALLTARGMRVTGQERPARFWLLMALLTTLMFLEDSINTRHMVAGLTQLIFAAGGLTNWVKTATELIIYAIMGFIPIYAVIRYRDVVLSSLKTTVFLAGGIACYGLASVASASRDIGDWYAVVGSKVVDALGNGVMNQFFTQTDPQRPLGYFLMDFMFEESVEVLGAAFLCAAALYWWQKLKKENPHLKVADIL